VRGNDGAFLVALERDQAAGIERFDGRAVARADELVGAKKPDFRILEQGVEKLLDTHRFYGVRSPDWIINSIHETE